MPRIFITLLCVAAITACGRSETAATSPPAAEPVVNQVPALAPAPTIDSLIDSVPAEGRDALLQSAIEKVADEYRADWMLGETAGNLAMWQHAVAIYQSGKQGLTFYSLIKESFQITREDFLNRAEVASTSADILARAQADAARNRQISRMLREQELMMERQQAARQAAYESRLQAHAQAEAAYANAAYEQQRAQRAYQEQQQRPMPVNPSRFDPENVGFDPSKGYTSPRYSSSGRSGSGNATQVQTGPRRFQDQNGNWYEQQPGSGFARNERTGQQCFMNGSFVHCN